MSVIIRQWQPQRMIEREQIEQIESHGRGLPAAELDGMLYDNQCWCIVAEDERCKAVVGYLAYYLRPRHVRIASVGVYPSWRRQGVGRGLVVAVAKLYRMVQHGTTAILSEYDLPSQLFFQRCGFRWIDTIPGSEDQYIMRWHAGGAAVPWGTANRVAAHYGGR